MSNSQLTVDDLVSIVEHIFENLLDIIYAQPPYRAITLVELLIRVISHWRPTPLRRIA